MKYEYNINMSREEFLISLAKACEKQKAKKEGKYKQGPFLKVNRRTGTFRLYYLKYAEFPVGITPIRFYGKIISETGSTEFCVMKGSIRMMRGIYVGTALMLCAYVYAMLGGDWIGYAGVVGMPIMIGIFRYLCFATSDEANSKLICVMEAAIAGR